MLRRVYLLGLVFILILAVGLTGCSKDSTEPTTSDEDTIKELIDSPAFADFFYSDGTVSGEDEGEFENNKKDTVYPRGLWRQITKWDRNISVNIEGDRAEVEFQRTLEGIFHLLALDTLGSTNLEDHHKDLNDRFNRKAVFVRDENASRGWKLSEVSYVTVEPVGKSDIIINSLRVRTSNSKIDTTINYENPPNTFNKDNLIVVTAGDTVWLELTVNDSTILGALHRRRRRMPPSFYHRPKRFYWDSEKQVLTNWWVIGEVNSQYENVNSDIDFVPRHIFIDLLTYDTVYTDENNYDSKAWGLIYGVKIPDVAKY